jgi:general secretion pathway protein K
MSQRGFALLAVMLVLALLGVVAAELAYSMRLEASMVRAYRDGVLAMHLAEAGIEQATREILSTTPVQGLDDDGQVVFYRAIGGQSTVTRLPVLKRTRVPLGPGQFSYRISDEEARINVNTAPAARIDNLLRVMGLEKEARDVVNDSLQDWKDRDDNHRINGAESEDYYLKLPVPYRARNALLQDPAELLQIRGVTSELYWGTKDAKGKVDKPGLAEHVTVFGRNTVNINTASPLVLRALNFSEAEISEVEQTRRLAPYIAVQPRFSPRGVGVSTVTFRIEAEGWVAGERQARVMAIVQRRAPTTVQTRTVVLPGAASSTTPSEPAAPSPMVFLAWRVLETGRP